MTEEKKPSTDFISSYSKAQQKMIATSIYLRTTRASQRSRTRDQRLRRSERAYRKHERNHVRK